MWNLTTLLRIGIGATFSSINSKVWPQHGDETLRVIAYYSHFPLLKDNALSHSNFRFSATALFPQEFSADYTFECLIFYISKHFTGNWLCWDATSFCRHQLPSSHTLYLWWSHIDLKETPRSAFMQWLKTKSEGCDESQKRTLLPSNSRVEIIQPSKEKWKIPVQDGMFG